MKNAFLEIPVDDLGAILSANIDQWELLRDQTILLTGGTGFIGKWLLSSFLYVNRKLDLNSKIIVVSRNVWSFRTAHPDLLDANEITWIEGDVRTFQLTDLKVGFVIHAATDVVASSTESDIFDTCVQGTRNVLEIMQLIGAKRMLLLSSGAVYGRTPSSLDKIPEEWSGAPDCLQASSAYAEGKRVSELLCALTSKNSDFIIPVARCFAFVGPYLPLDKHFAIGNFIRDALNGDALMINGDGTPLRSYMYAADMAAWLWALLFRGQSLRAYNVGGDESISIAQLAERIVSILGVSSKIVIAKRPTANMQIQKYIPDLQRIRDELGVKFNYPLDEAIQRTVRWVAREKL